MGFMDYKLYARDFVDIIAKHIASELFDLTGLYKIWGAPVSANSNHKDGIGIAFRCYLPVEEVNKNIYGDTLYNLITTDTSKAIDNDYRTQCLWVTDLDFIKQTGARPNILDTFKDPEDICKKYWVSSDSTVLTGYPGEELLPDISELSVIRILCSNLGRTLRKVGIAASDFHFKLASSVLNPKLTLEIITTNELADEAIEQAISSVALKSDSVYICRGMPGVKFTRTYTGNQQSGRIKVEFSIQSGISKAKTTDISNRCLEKSETFLEIGSLGERVPLPDVEPFVEQDNSSYSIKLQAKVNELASKSRHNPIQSKLRSLSEYIKGSIISEHIYEHCISMLKMIAQPIEKYSELYDGVDNPDMEDSIIQLIDKVENQLYQMQAKEQLFTAMDLKAEIQAVSNFLDLKNGTGGPKMK